MTTMPATAALESEFVLLSKRLAADYTNSELRRQWRSALSQRTAAQLTIDTADLAAEGDDSRKVKALREAVIAEIERQNAVHLAATMKHLDNSAKALTYISLAIAVIGLLLAAVQVWQAATRA